MAQKQCERGHFYDPNQYSQCPHCPIEGLDLGKPGPVAAGPPVPPPPPPAGRPAAVPVGNQRGQTVAIWPNQGNAPAKLRRLDPVVGWLVAVAGPALGRDFRIHWGNNSIGRDPDQAISLSEDEGVHGKGHAFVIYDPRNNAFLLRSGNQRGLVHVGNEEEGPLELVLDSAKLVPYVPIHIGNSKLIFVPLCSDLFKWQLGAGSPDAAANRP